MHLRFFNKDTFSNEYPISYYQILKQIYYTYLVVSKFSELLNRMLSEF